MTKADYEQFCLGLFHLATQIGIRPASRALGISESKGMKIAWRRKWHIGRLAPALSGSHHRSDPRASDAWKQDGSVEVVKGLLASGSTRTKLALSQAAATASEHLASLEGSKLMAPSHGIAADTWSRTADRVHGWTAERSKPLMQVANIVALPSVEEREMRDKAHRALDDIARALRLRE